MKLDLGKSRLGLDQDQLIAVRDGKGVRVACLSGAVWITQEASTADVLLEAGESFVIDHPGLTVVMALRPSNLRVCETHASAFALLESVAGWFSSQVSRVHAAV